MKKSVIVVIIIVFSICSSFMYIQFKKHQASESVVQYLIEEKGYEKSDIKSVQSVYSFLGIPTYYVNITFQNEPNIVYSYFSHHVKGQFEYYDHSGKTIPTEDLKNYDPSSD